MCVSVYLSVHLNGSLCVWIYVSVYLSVHLNGSLRIWIYGSIGLPVRVSVRVVVCLSVRLDV